MRGNTRRVTQSGTSEGELKSHDSVKCGARHDSFLLPTCIGHCANQSQPKNPAERAPGGSASLKTCVGQTANLATGSCVEFDSVVGSSGKRPPYQICGALQCNRHALFSGIHSRFLHHTLVLCTMTFGHIHAIRFNTV